MIGATLLETKYAQHLRPYRFVSSAATHAGCVRTLNEDACLDRPDIGLWAVADGMGGHASGDVASQTVIRHLNSVASFSTAFHFRQAVRTALMTANVGLRKKADDELLDMIGSTVVAFLVHRGHFACIWAGDSRAYRLRDGKLHLLTRDHSLLRQLQDNGSVSEEDLRMFEGSKVVTRAVGAADSLELDGIHGGIEKGDRFLLCSDGLDVLTDAEIENAIAASDLTVATDRLMREALARKATDNVSVVMIEAAAP